MSIEQIETADGDVKLNAAGLMLLQMLVLLALVVQMSAGQRSGGTANTDDEVPLVRRYHIEVALYRHDPTSKQGDHRPETLFTSADEMRWALLIDGAPLGEPKVVGTKSPEPFGDERAEVRTHYKISSTNIVIQKADNKIIEFNQGQTTVGIDIEINEGHSPRTVELLFAARSKPVPAGKECQAFWDRVADQFDLNSAQKTLPAMRAKPEEFRAFEWSKCRVTDLQANTSDYVIAPNAILIPAITNPYFLTVHSFPLDQQWRDSFFDSVKSVAAGAEKGTNDVIREIENKKDSNNHLYTKLYLARPLTGAVSPVTFYYRLTVQFPDSEGTPAPKPIVKFLPTRTVPEAVKFGGSNP